MDNRYHDLKKRANRYWEAYNQKEIVCYLKKYCGEEVNELIRQADMLLEQTFVFQDRWDMEPCRIPYTMNLDSWVESPNGDEEWVFMLNRHDFLPKLWYAYLLTEKEKYIEKLRWYLFDWIEKNPITAKGTMATRTIDTGIRCMNWCNLIVPMIATGNLNDKEIEKLLQVLGEQFLNLRERYIDKYSLSNWGVLQTTAICVAYIWFKDFLPESIDDWAWDELKTQLDLQILEDGSHWEQSAMYHVEVLNSITRVLVHLKAAKKAGISLSEKAVNAMTESIEWDSCMEVEAGPGEGFLRCESGWMASAIRVLSRHVYYTADPQRNQLAQCDSDVTDISDVMARTAVLLDGGNLYRSATDEHMDMDSVWILGASGIEKFEDTQPHKSNQLAWSCLFGGNIFIRSSWDKNANFTWMKNSTLGSGHGHADQSHLSIFYKGYPYLVDSGRYTYREDDPLRMKLKNPAAHNVCVIDGESGGDADASWTFASCAEVLKNYFYSKKNVHFVELPSYGVLKNGTPYVIIRKVLILDDGIWLSVQDVICQGSHIAQEYFHLDNEVKVEHSEKYVLLRNCEDILYMYSDEGFVENRGIISKKYNELLEASVLTKTVAFTDRLTTSVIFAGVNYLVRKTNVFQYGKNEPVSQETVTAWDVYKDSQLKYTLLIWNRETYRGGKMYICHGKPVYGKTVVLSWDGDECQRIRMKN